MFQSSSIFSLKSLFPVILAAELLMCGSAVGAAPEQGHSAIKHSGARTGTPAVSTKIARTENVGQAKSLKNAAEEKDSSRVTPEFCRQTLEKVNELVEQHYYNPAQLPAWREALAKARPEILASTDIIAFDAKLNNLIATLHASHCEFLTRNDEAYFFIESLFHRDHHGTPYKGHAMPPKMDYIGAITGGVNCSAKQVRYVVDGSPAAKAGIRTGDELLKVDGEPYIGQLCFQNKSGKRVHVVVSRPTEHDGSHPVELDVIPRKAFASDEYCAAIRTSASIDPATSIGYVHLWTGSGSSHDIIEELLAEKLAKSKGLIFDMRDGYGGAFFDDLDYFFRPPAAFPKLTTTDRNGKANETILYYDKPLVALINGGSRSGKELLAYSLKKSRRGTLVGENTAGMVLAASLFDINDRCALYLAVQNVEVNGERLEQKGVAPDAEVKMTCEQRALNDSQLEEARKILREKMQAAPPQGATRDH